MDYAVCYSSRLHFLKKCARTQSHNVYEIESYRSLCVLLVVIASSLFIDLHLPEKEKKKRYKGYCPRETTR